MEEGEAAEDVLQEVKINLWNGVTPKCATEYNNVTYNTDGREMYGYDSDLVELFEVSGISEVNRIDIEREFNYDPDSYEPVGSNYGDYLYTCVLRQNHIDYHCKCYMMYNGCSAEEGLDLHNITLADKSMKLVTNIHGERVAIDVASRKLREFNNVKREVVYSAKETLNDSDMDFYTEYIEKGTIDDIELKLQTWNNTIKLLYAELVNFNSEANDPDKKIWDSIVEFAKKNKDKIFTQKGNFRKRCIVNIHQIKRWRLDYEN